MAEDGGASQFLKKDQELSLYDYQAMSRGLVSFRETHFYDWTGQQKGPEDLPTTMGASFAQYKLGARIPDTKQAKNPTLNPPSVTAQKYFGQQPTVKIAMDQLFAKRIGVFMAEIGGAGAGGFFLQNNPIFAGAQTVQSILGKMMLGKEVTELNQNFSKVFSLAQQMQSIIGADSITEIDLSKADELARVMQGAAQVFAGGQQVFDPSIFSDGAAFAKDVQAHIQKYYR